MKIRKDRGRKVWFWPITNSILIFGFWRENHTVGGRIMAVYVFSKWRSAAILDFHRSEIWRYFCFQDVVFSLWAKFCVNTCNNDWVMAIKVNFQNGGRRHLEFCRIEIWRQGQSRLSSIYLRTKFGGDILKGGGVMTIYVFFKMAAGRHLGFSEKWNLKVFLFRRRRLFSLSQILCNLCKVVLKWIFKMAAAAILNFVEVKFDDRVSRGWPVSISVPNFVKISWRAAELWRFVFLKWRPAAILDFQISEIWRYFCFQDVGFSPWAKFCVNICNSDWVMVVN